MVQKGSREVGLSYLHALYEVRNGQSAWQQLLRQLRERIGQNLCEMQRGKPARLQFLRALRQFAGRYKRGGILCSAGSGSLGDSFHTGATG